MQGAEPVGVDADGTLILPPSYSPKNGPPVLMLHPDEEGRTITLPTNPVDISNVERISAQSGTPVTAVPPHLLVSKSVALRMAHGVILSTPLRLTPGSGDPPFDIMVPRLMAIQTPLGRNILSGETLAHEADHWNFFMNTAGTLQNNPSRRYDVAELHAIAEKRAYTITRQVRANVGHEAEGLAHQEIVDIMSGHPAVLAIGTLAASQKGSLAQDAAVMVGAITELYGKEDEPITDDELYILKLLKIIQFD